LKKKWFNFSNYFVSLWFTWFRNALTTMWNLGSRSV
jgi:hypothetical protein